MPFSDCIIEVVKTSYGLFEDTLFPHRFVNLLEVFKRIVHLSGLLSRPSPNFSSSGLAWRIVRPTTWPCS